jgi:hypothetical protein
MIPDSDPVGQVIPGPNSALKKTRPSEVYHLQILSVNVVFADLRIWAGRKNQQVPKNFARQNTQERISCCTMIVKKPFLNLLS